MAMMYDTMGNQTGYDEQQAIDDELERKKKEEEQRLKDQALLGPAVPNTTGLNAPQLQNGQGPGQIPAGGGAIGPAVPPQAQAPAPAQPAPAQGAVVPTPQDQYIAQNESGNNPNIGYHNPKLSSAYGTFGLTKGAYQDIQAADPYFQGKDITQLTPDEQTRANQTYQGVLGKQLQAQGVEVNSGNLAAAHFVGAKGLADYNKNGTISKAAADANGGAARVAHIIEERRKMAPAPASGAATGSTLPQGTTDQHLADIDSGDKNKLMTLAQSPFAPKPVVSMALDTLHENLYSTKKFDEAQKKVDADLEAGKIPNMNQRGEEGSYIKAYLYQRLGLTDLARQEQEKISPTLKSSAMIVNEQNYHVKQNVNGEIVKAWNDQGKPVDAKTLANLNANAYNAKTAQQHAQVYADPTGKVSGTFVLETRPGGMPVYKRVGGGANASPAEAAMLKSQGVQGSLEYQQMQEQQKADIKLDSLRKSLALRLQGVPATEWNKETAKFNREFNSNLAYMDNPYLKPNEIKNASAQAMPTAQADAQTSAQAMPTAQAGAQALPTAQAGAVAPVATAGLSPAQIRANQQAQAAVLKEQSLTPGVVNREEQTVFVKHKDAIAESATTGRDTADITRTQISNLLTTPEMMGYLTAGPGTTQGQIGKFIREVATGSYDSEESGKKFADKIRELSIPLALQGKIEEYRQQNQKINALTLRSNEGPGSISNFENRQNQAANMSNIGDLTPYSVLNGLGRRQFVGDLTMAKQQYLASHPELNTRTTFDSAWEKQTNLIKKGYEGIYNARLTVLKPYYDQASKAPNDERAQQAYRDAAIQSFKTYPTPDYNPQTGSWEYKTKQAKLAAMAAIAGGQ